MLSVFCSPTRYTQGKRATENLGSELATLGIKGPALIVAGATPIARLSEVWRRSLDAAGIAFEVVRFGGECTLAEIERVERAGRERGCRVVLGSGGGKVIDTARAVAAHLGTPVVSCPTIASTDSPCSALSVIYSEAGEVQEIRTYGRSPDLVLVDTQVIAESPPRFLVAGMGDALATWFEAKTCVEGRVKNARGGASTRTAAALAELCYRTLLDDGVAALRAVESRAVTPAFERLVEANTLLSGLGFESSGLAAAHAVHNGLTVAPGTHRFLHGEKVSFGLLVQLVLEGQPTPVWDEVLGFASAVGLPITLAGIGLTEAPRALLESIATRATAAGETIHNEPFRVDAAMVVDALLTADAIGRAWQRDHDR